MSTYQKQTLSTAELYAVEFQRGEPAYFTQVPNIIDHLTYTFEKDGLKETKRLSVYAKELYRILRMVASDHGKCWHSTESLAEIVGCSTGKISQAKNELLMPMHQLDGTALIIEKMGTTTRKLDSGDAIQVPFSHKTIVNIWGWNSAFMATRKFQNQYGRDSCGESPKPRDSCDESPPLDRDSCGERNNNQCLLDPICNVQHPTADADPVVFKSEKKERERRLLPSDKKKAFNWMIAHKCSPVAALDFVNKYSSYEIELASSYIMEKMKKSKINNMWGYFRTVMEGRFWKNQKA